VLPPVRFSPATSVEFIAAANTSCLYVIQSIRVRSLKMPFEAINAYL